MPLTLYRRHVKSCRVHATKLSPRAKRNFIDCECPIWIYGRTEKNILPRQSVGTTDWKVAEAQRATLTNQAKDEKIHGPSLADCAELYLASREPELAEQTLKHHELVLRRFQDYAKARGIYFAGELTVDTIERFFVEGLPGLASNTKGTLISKLKCFLKDAFRRGWIKENLCDRLRPHKAVYGQKDPYTDEEVEAILAEALKMYGGRDSYAAYPETFRLLLEFMLETGLRVSDAVLYNPKATIKGKSMWVYSYIPQKLKRTERPKVLETFLTDQLKKAIDECEWMSESMPFHYVTDSAVQPVHENLVYDRMQMIGERCGIADCRPHRLRDTFAIRALLRGLLLEEVSRLLGHSSISVTEKYYAKWVRARSERLESRVAESLLNA